MKIKAYLITAMIMAAAVVCSQEFPFPVVYTPGEKYKITEISDLRKRVNDKYIGFTYRQIRGVMDVSGENGLPVIKGNFYVFQETKNNSVLLAGQIDRVVYSEFKIDTDNRITIEERYNYPLNRNFPVMPEKPLIPGQSWKAEGTRLVEPFADNVFTKVKFLCEYTYNGIKEYKGIKAHLVTGQYALRYKKGDDPKGDPRITAITNGGHEITLYYDLQTKRPLFMKDNIIENLGGEIYKLSDNTTINYKGFTQTWYDPIVPMDKEKTTEQIKTDINEKLKEKLKDQENIIVKEKENGIQLTLPDIRFAPESAVILASENARLEALAAALKKIPDRTMLVTGHTADIGAPESQYMLSVQRAKTIVDFLVSKGIPEKRFLYQGKGGTEPVAPNDIEENMLKNRRVEITILED